MAVFKLTPTHKGEIISNVMELAERGIRLRTTCCPFEASEIELCTNSPEQLAAARTAAAMGYSVGTVKDFLFSIKQGDLGTFELPRSAVFQLNTREGIFGLFRSMNHNMQYAAYSNGKWSIDFTQLGQERCDKIGKWVLDMIRARRERNIVYHTIGTFVRYVENTGELLANWPSLNTFVHDEALRPRLNNPPRDMRKYKWDIHPESRSAKNQLPKYIQAADTICSRGMMLANATTNVPEEQGISSVRLVRYQEFDTDDDYTRDPY